MKQRVRWLTAFFMLALALSGATAIPLESELYWLIGQTAETSTVGAATSASRPGWAAWLTRVHAAIQATNTQHPFMAYGTDWLAFGHFVIAIVFVGALRDPIRNRWLFTFGMIACALVPPYALIFGAVRGIPGYWRLIDCSFGVFGIVPLWLCRRWTSELERRFPGG